MLSTLQKNLRIKNRQSFTASLSEGKNSRFIAVNHSEVRLMLYMVLCAENSMDEPPDMSSLCLEGSMRCGVSAEEGQADPRPIHADKGAEPRVLVGAVQEREEAGRGCQEDRRAHHRRKRGRKVKSCDPDVVVQEDGGHRRQGPQERRQHVDSGRGCVCCCCFCWA